MSKSEKIKNQIADRQRQKETHEAKRVPIQQRIDVLTEARNEHLLGIVDGKDTSASDLEKIDSEAAKLSSALTDNQTIVGLIDKKISELQSSLATAQKEETAEEVKDLLRSCRKRIPDFTAALEKTKAAVSEIITVSQAIDKNANVLKPETFGQGRMSAAMTLNDILIWDLYSNLGNVLRGMPHGRPSHLPSLEQQLETVANELAGVIG
jgi:chromosome segregation ATPase